MSSIFHIKVYLLSVFLWLNTSIYAQQEETKENNQETSEKSTEKNFQKLGFGALEYAQPITTGDNFFGLGMQGKGGFNIKAQFFLYKHIFISGTLGNNYFDVIDKSVVGNYNKVKLNYNYLSLGYEIIPLKDVRIGLSFSVFGETKYENESLTDTRESFQFDDGNARGYNMYLDYLFKDDLAIYISYTYRNDKTNIVTAPEIQPLFEYASFHNIGIGIKLYFGQSDIIPQVFN